MWFLRRGWAVGWGRWWGVVGESHKFNFIFHKFKRFINS